MLLKNCRVLDSTTWTLKESQNILIEADEIKEITDQEIDSTEVIDLKSGIVLPGLIDAHVHTTFTGDPNMFDFDEVSGVIKSAKRLKDYLNDGITYIRDVGGLNHVMTQMRQAVEQGIFVGPGIKCCDQFITMTGGHGYQGGRVAEGEIELRRAVREQLAHNVDFIKIMGTWGCMEDAVETGTPQYTEEEFRVVVDEAGRHGRKVAVHIGGTKAAIDAINAGVHSIEHGILWDEEAIDLLVEKGVWFIPTITPPYRMYYDVMADSGFPQWMVEKVGADLKKHCDSFKMAVEKGAKIAAGTDAGTPFNPHGQLRFELKLMVKYGMTPQQAIEAATINGAECLGIKDKYGSIEPGKKADLIVLEKNPLEDINNLDTLQIVIKHGKIVVNKD